MCLAIPGQIVEMVDSATHIAKVDVGGVKRNVNVGLLTEPPDVVTVGDWVLIHVGFALSKVDEAEAAATLAMLRGMGEAYEDELEQLKSSDIA
ncbi:MAG: HypC/HybG/HupF family hydrogenase formation chaperone [Actinomycetota bacterium]